MDIKKLAILERYIQIDLQKVEIQATCEAFLLYVRSDSRASCSKVCLLYGKEKLTWLPNIRWRSVCRGPYSLSNLHPFFRRVTSNGSKEIGRHVQEKKGISFGGLYHSEYCRPVPMPLFLLQPQNQFKNAVQYLGSCRVKNSTPLARSLAHDKSE